MDKKEKFTFSIEVPEDKTKEFFEALEKQRKIGPSEEQKQEIARINKQFLSYDKHYHRVNGQERDMGKDKADECTCPEDLIMEVSFMTTQCPMLDKDCPLHGLKDVKPWGKRPSV